MALLTESRTESRATFAPWPYFAPDEIEAAAAVLRGGEVNYWTGAEGRQFEREFAEFTNCKHAVALANGTVALEAALRALDIGPGDEVITTSRTFIASASCAVAVGARPVIADVHPDSQNITVESIRSVLSPRTKAIVAVHLAGWPCEMDPILELAAEHGLKVVEDCAQAVGATYRGRPVGSLGDVAAFSFCQDKIMTTGGEGGMVTTDSDDLWEKMWAYKDHGKSYDAVYRREHDPGYRWLHESFGTNWRMTEVQSAIGRVALRKLGHWLSVRTSTCAKAKRRLCAVTGSARHPSARARRPCLLQILCVLASGRVAAGLEPRPHRRRHQRRGSAVFYRQLQRDLSRKGISSRLAAEVSSPCGARIGRNQPNVPGASHAHR